MPETITGIDQVVCHHRQHVSILEVVQIEGIGLNLIILAEILILLGNRKTHRAIHIIKKLKLEVGQIRYHCCNCSNPGSLKIVVHRIELIRLIKNLDALPLGEQCPRKHVVAPILQCLGICILENSIELGAD